MMNRRYSQYVFTERWMAGQLTDNVKKDIWEMMANEAGLPIELIDTPLVERTTTWSEERGAWICRMQWLENLDHGKTKLFVKP